MKQNWERGFTVVEMIVSSTLGLLLVATIMGLLNIGRMVWQDSESKISTLQEVRKGLSEISLDLPRASWLSPASADCPAGITIPEDGSSICFRFPQSIIGQTITWGDTLRYRIDDSGTQLIRENLTTGETKVVANFITSVTFSPVGTPPSAYVSVVLGAQNRSLSTRSFQSSLQTNFSVRN